MRIRFAGLCARALTTLCILLATSTALAQEVRVDIPPQSLDSALKAFSDATGMQFIYVEADIGSVRTRGVSGTLTADAALQRLLDDTGLQHEYANDNTVRLFRPEAAPPASAPEEARNDPPVRTLEEIVITARKREESLQDVPISVQVVSGEEIREQNIVNLQDLSAQVPNLFVTESYVGDAVYVRGIGSGQNNLGFEQAVGQVIDGFFYGRSRYSRFAFMDVERVEVLKGPQGALIGKNTTAGAINITTARPTREFEAWLQPTYEFEGAEGWSVEGAISGPLSDSVAGRLAFSVIDRDGFIHNTFTGQDDVRANDWSARGSLLWDIADNADLLLQYQTGEIRHDGGNNQLSFCDFTSQQVPGAPVNVNFTAIFAGIAPDDCTANYERTATAGKFGENVEGKKTDFDSVTATLNWDFDRVQLTSLTGFARYDYRDEQDGDRTYVDVLTNDTFGTLPEFAEDYEQFSQELRISSAVSDQLDLIAGVYFLDKTQETEYIVHFANLAGQAISRNTFTREEGRTYAAFAQVDYAFNDRWSLTAGARFTYEEKEARSVQVPTELYTYIPQDCTLPAAGACYRHDISDDLSENDFSPNLSVQWYPTGDSMFYANVARGFKAGGYDHVLVSDEATDPNILERFVFDPEEVLSYELGTKLTLADGTAQLNAALFRSEFDDLQLGGFLNSTEVINTVTNAGSAITQGVELELRWRPLDRLTLFAAVAYLDSTYDEYTDAPCYTLQVTGCVNGRQDLSGEPLQFATDWKGTANAEYVWTLPGGMDVIGWVQYAFVDDFPLQADLDPKLWQDGYGKIDARLTLASADGNWQVSLIGRNLTDKLTSNYGDDVPGQAGTVWRSVDAPRSFAVQALFRF
ncbi:TonB-dependent receptor domain-containing protein [Elongatibacter sediminis]|uniref:TonB-dependent receptor n=1 Tax=Elongatibacter sediminis TaxID=3119006 RepID=A0AAW9R8S1_9GAMM